MATFTAEFLSASTDGVPVAVTATASPGTTIHTAHASAMDGLKLYALNVTTGNLRLTLEFGSTLAKMEYLVPYWEGEFPLTDGTPVLSNSKACSAIATASNVLFVGGFAMRRAT